MAQGRRCPEGLLEGLRIPRYAWHAKLVIGRVLARMSRRSLASAMRTWKARVLEYRRQRALIEKVLGRMAQVLQVSAFESWVSWAEESLLCLKPAEGLNPSCLSADEGGRLYLLCNPPRREGGGSTCFVGRPARVRTTGTGTGAGSGPGTGRNR